MSRFVTHEVQKRGSRCEHMTCASPIDRLCLGIAMFQLVQGSLCCQSDCCQQSHAKPATPSLKSWSRERETATSSVFCPCFQRARRLVTRTDQSWHPSAGYCLITHVECSLYTHSETISTSTLHSYCSSRQPPTSADVSATIDSESQPSSWWIV